MGTFVRCSLTGSRLRTSATPVLRQCRWVSIRCVPAGQQEQIYTRRPRSAGMFGDLSTVVRCGNVVGWLDVPQLKPPMSMMFGHARPFASTVRCRDSVGGSRHPRSTQAVGPALPWVWPEASGSRACRPRGVSRLASVSSLSSPSMASVSMSNSAFTASATILWPECAQAAEGHSWRCESWSPL